jgi:hypothetical protein
MKNSNIFWVSYADLMTSLFFIMLVLYIITFALLKQNEEELHKTVEDLRKKELALQNAVENLEQKLEVYELVEQNLKPLKENTQLFRYEEDYKRFTLAFNVEFEVSKFEIKKNELKNYEITSKKIENVGRQLQRTVDVLANKKHTNKAMKNVSYLIIISGYSSHLLSGTQDSDYLLSYNRAYSLWNYWKELGIDFEDKKYDGLIDLQISGNGWGGVGRYKRDPDNFFENETRNQRFIIQIVPKIGDV